MLEFKDVCELAIGAMGFGAGVLHYIAQKQDKQVEKEEEGEALPPVIVEGREEFARATDYLEEFQRFTQRLEQAHTSRDQACRERDEAVRDKDHAGIESFQNVLTLLDIIRRIAVICVGHTSRQRRVQQEILAIIRHRDFTSREAVLAELEDIFGLNHTPVLETEDQNDNIRTGI